MTRVGRRGESADVPEYNYILLAAPPLVRNGHKASIPPVFECLHGHIQLGARKHGVVVALQTTIIAILRLEFYPRQDVDIYFFFFDVKLFNSSSRCKKMCNDLRLRVMIIYIT